MLALLPLSGTEMSFLGVLAHGLNEWARCSGENASYITMVFVYFKKIQSLDCFHLLHKDTILCILIYCVQCNKACKKILLVMIHERLLISKYYPEENVHNIFLELVEHSM